MQISYKISVFHERIAPEEGLLVGYGALIHAFDLRTPLPDRLALISEKHKRYETPQWMIFTPRHLPPDNLYGHLIFALKNEGIDLLVLKTLFVKTGNAIIKKLVLSEPTSQYSRRIWFLYEWLMNERLDIEDLQSGNYVELLNEKLQYVGPSVNSGRHRVRNNLPGSREFCPLIRRTEKLDHYLAADLSGQTKNSLSSIHKDILLRASAFLLLKDSKASFAIEGETPGQNRAQRWGKAIGQAGQKPLSEQEFLRLQQIVIADQRFVKMGWREQQGFIGEHDRLSGAPIPDHISARWQDLADLLQGLLKMDQKLMESDFDAVLAAACIAFGFVFIHPFVDGNGRIHRYLIHHILARKGFAPKGLIFPVSAAILAHLDEYRQVLEHFSLPRLDFIDWKQAPDYNVEVLNETADLYRYFDATRQAEFLYQCVQETVEEIIPQEVAYLEKYSRMKDFIEAHFEMPDQTISLLVRFLEQGNGRLSKRARTKEFKTLTDEEVERVEEAFGEIFF
jgi:Fic family protein